MNTVIPPPPLPIPRGPKPKPETIQATRYVLDGGWSIKAAARHFGISHSVIISRIKGLKEGRNLHEAGDQNA